MLAYQCRPLSDALFSYAVHRLCGIEGSFWFVLTAKSVGPPGDTDELEGKIYIYKSREDWREKGDPIVRPRRKRLNDLANSIEVYRDETVAELFSEAEAGLLGGADIWIDYHLLRTGEVYFSKPAFQEEELHATSQAYAATSGSALDFDKWIADQSYFFLRDITHVHQHHSKSSDTILILQYRDDEQDFAWRKRIIYALQHYIIRAKRFSDAPSLAQALGIHGYCMSFQAICKERTIGTNFELPRFNDAALVQSMTARMQEVTTKASEDLALATFKMTKAANTRLFALAFITILIALMVMLIQPMIETKKFPRLLALAEALAENVFNVAGFLAVCLITVFAYTSSDWQVNTKFGRDVLEASNYRRYWSIAFYLGAAMLVGLVTFYLSKPAIMDIWDTFTEFWNLLLFK